MAPKAFKAPANWVNLLERLKVYRKSLKAPVDTIGCDCLVDPKASKQVQRFQILVALMLSAQTKDEVTANAMRQLLDQGLTPVWVSKIPVENLNGLIQKVGFHNTKAANIKAVADILLEKYGGSPPSTYEDIIALPGVGPKMAHLFFQAADGQILGIGVDTHVHRISQRFKWVPSTVKNPEDTRRALESWLPKKHWGEINKLLVGLGQTVCFPINPGCSSCQLSDICPNAFKEKSAQSAKKTKRKRVGDLEDVISGMNRAGKRLKKQHK